MPLPADIAAVWSKVPVYGTYGELDPVNGDWEPASGTVDFELSERLVVTGAESRYIVDVPTKITATLDGAGKVFVLLPAVDDPEITPNTVAWKVTEHIDGQGVEPSYYIRPSLDLLDLSPPGLDLAGVILPASQARPPASLVRGVPGGVPGLDADMRIVDADGNVPIVPTEPGGGGGGSTGPVSPGDLVGITPIGVALLEDSTTATDARATIDAASTGALVLKADQTALTAGLAGKQSLSARNQPNGYPGLGPDGKIAAGMLPGGTEEIVEYDSTTDFPATGSVNVYYLALDTSYLYRWASTQYVLIPASPGTTDNVPEGPTNLYFTPARAEAALADELAGKADAATTGAALATKADAAATTAALAGKAPATHSHTAAQTSTTAIAGVAGADVQAMLGSLAARPLGGTAEFMLVIYSIASAAYPTQGATPPPGVRCRLILGPYDPSFPAWSGVIDLWLGSDGI